DELNARHRRTDASAARVDRGAVAKLRRHDRRLEDVVPAPCSLGGRACRPSGPGRPKLRAPDRGRCRASDDVARSRVRTTSLCDEHVGEMPEAHAGRLLGHLHLRVRDLEPSRRFYRAAVEAVGLRLSGEGEGWFSADELFVSEDAAPTERVHIAFQAADRDVVERFYEAAIAAGGTDNGAPGERSYHPGYYAAFVLDPDGNNVEAVYHGPTERSAPSVVFSWR